MSHSLLTLNLGEGSVSFSFSPEAALSLKGTIDQLMASLKAVSTQGGAGKKTPHPAMEYCHTGEVFLELFCNPNIWPSPFAAKVLITLRDDRIRLTSEAELTRVIEDLNQYIEQN